MLRAAAPIRVGASRPGTSAPLASPSSLAHRRGRIAVCHAAEPGQASQSGGIAYPVVSALAGVGALETAYLTLVKLYDTPLVCPTSGCEEILNSGWSSLFGIPLSLLGMLTYTTVAGIAASAALQQRSSSSGEVVSEGASSSGRGGLLQPDNLLLCGVTLLSTCSAALMYILFTQFEGEACAWCFLSAGLSLSLLLTVTTGMGLERLRASAAPGAGALVASLAALYLGFADSSNASSPTELAYNPAPITSKSSKQALDLASKLKQSGAKMYGAFWCSHCFEQKQTFGKEAMATFPYVECFPEGWRRGQPIAQTCADAGVRAFPTWVINGRNVEGDLTLEALQLELDTPVGQPSPNVVYEEDEGL